VIFTLDLPKSASSMKPGDKDSASPQSEERPSRQ